MDTKIKSHASSTVETITPEQAAAWLKTSRGNRPILTRFVHTIARDIASGKFALNGEPIIIDNQGSLIDGHHRLAAIVLSGVSVRSFVARGVDPLSFRSIDSGRSRSASDAASLSGMSNNVHRIAAASRLLLCWLRGSQPSNIRFSNDEILTSMEMYADALFEPDFREWRRDGLWTSPAGTTVAACLTRLANKELSNRFWSEVRSGENMKAGTATYALRRFATSFSSRNTKTVSMTHIGFCLKAWNMFVDGKQCTTLVYRPGNEKPPIVRLLDDRYQYGAERENTDQ